VRHFNQQKKELQKAKRVGKLMVEEGVLQNPQVDVILDTRNTQTEVGQIKYRPKGTMAASDWFTIKMGKTNTWRLSMAWN
jgi:metal-dependent amidase/aminoacylase/carboxypeptidase family protein